MRSGNSPWHSYMTKAVFERVHKDAKLSTTGKDMWTAVTREIDGKKWSLYKSNWSREP